jgi:hypothetical protein
VRAALRAALALAALAAVTDCGGREVPAARPVAEIDVTPTTTAAPVAMAAAATTAAPATPEAALPSSAVRIGNQRPIGSAALTFAKYLNAMHNRIHPRFTDEALSRLDGLRPNDPLNDTTLMTRLELVIDGQTGRVVKQTVVRTSGLAAFDALAIDAVSRAAPFEPASAMLWSSDANVYVHWEFMRDPVFGCSTMHVRPFLLHIGAAPP